MDKVIPILSLVVAAIAVFFGPFISLSIARRQVMSSLEVANKQITAPMRQAWINSLRDLLAEVPSTALNSYERGEFLDNEQCYDVERRMMLLECKVKLMLNPNEQDHIKLEHLIRTIIKALPPQSRGDMPEARRNFENAHPAMIELSREVLKREWDRIKQPINPVSS